MSAPEYLAASNEFQAVDCYLDGVLVITGVELGTTQDSSASGPDSWSAATVLSGRTGLMTGGLTQGFHYVFARITAAPETIIRPALIGNGFGGFYIR
jgi:hypothetical protein